MDAFIVMPQARRRLICEQAGNTLGLAPAGVEKDFWVCWTLRELFALPESGPHLTFKGGTSLSKGWKLIERFSEDIDIVIDRDFLGFGGDQSPERAPSNKQLEKRLEDLKTACQRYIRESLAPRLAARLGNTLPRSAEWHLDNDADDSDAQTLLFQYPVAVQRDSYIRPVVKIELGASSDTDPSANPEIQPYLAEALPGELGESIFSVRTVAPERTFWEKVSLLHEEGYRTGKEGPKARLARHYYDLWCLIRAGIADRAVADTGLFHRVVAHRTVFFRRNRVAQASLRQGSLRLLPADDRRTAWKQDYDAMREAMFFGESPDFDEILRIVGEFERRFNKMAAAPSSS